MNSISDRMGSFGAVIQGVRAQLRSRVFGAAMESAGFSDETLRRGWAEVDRLGRSVARAGLEAGKAQVLGSLFDRRA